MRSKVVGTAVVAACLMFAAAPVGPSARAGDAVPAELSSDCDWLSGDLHLHTVYSHDSYGGPSDDDTGPEEFYTLGWTVQEEGVLAQSRGLDYLAITDHNNVDAQSDPGWESNDLIWLPDYENSLAGHAQMHGATRVYDNGAKTLTDVQRVAGELRADGGAFQINHPDDGDWLAEYGYDFMPDALEIWNIGVWAYEPPFPATNKHEPPLQIYDRFLDMGGHVAATGGSDNHWRSTTAAQGVGQPTTWICSLEPSAQGLLEGIRAGRTTISHQPPAFGGQRAFLSADGDRDGTFETILGGSVPPGSPVRVEVEGAPGANLRLVTNGSRTIGGDIPITSPDFTYEFDAPADSSWVRAEVFYEDGLSVRRELETFCDLIDGMPETDQGVAYCDHRLAVVALTSALYFQDETFDPATTLTYDGDTVTKAGSRATLAATLLDSTGAPIAGAPLAFTFRGTQYAATTDEAGRATVSVKVAGPPGIYQVVSDFAGNETYLPSQDHDDVVVTAGN